MAKTNKEILNAIRNEASAEYKERIPEVKGLPDAEKAYEAFTEYPTVRNEFMAALTAKVFKTLVMNKVWNNPLVMLKKGEVPYGQGIEQLFVDMATGKNFDENFGDERNAAGSLMAQEKSTVLARFIQRNFAYKYKVTLSNQRLRSAFSTEGGVARLIDGLVASVMTGANNKEFQDMLGILTRTKESVMSHNSGLEGKGLGKIEPGIIDRIAECKSTDNRNMFVQIKGSNGKGIDAKELTEQIRTYASELTFLSNKYNLAGVNTACQPEDLVLFTSSDVVAKLDVEVIAGAFNVSAADLNVRIIKVPMETFKQIARKPWCKGTSTEHNVTPVALLADKDAIQQYDTLIESGSFYNPDKLMTNMFVHRQGITAACDFAQTVVFGTKDN